MKIRILGNSIRLRLSQTEVRQLSEKGTVTEQTQFGPTAETTLVYTLEKRGDEPISATFSNNRIQVFLPDTTVDNWASSNEVSLENQMPLDNGNSLRILVEKDFKCLTDRNEDESDLFPNPAESC